MAKYPSRHHRSLHDMRLQRSEKGIGSANTKRKEPLPAMNNQDVGKSARTSIGHDDEPHSPRNFSIDVLSHTYPIGVEHTRLERHDSCLDLSKAAPDSVAMELGGREKDKKCLPNKAHGCEEGHTPIVQPTPRRPSCKKILSRYSEVERPELGRATRSVSAPPIATTRRTANWIQCNPDDTEQSNYGHEQPGFNFTFPQQGSAGIFNTGSLNYNGFHDDGQENLLVDVEEPLSRTSSSGQPGRFPCVWCRSKWGAGTDPTTFCARLRVYTSQLVVHHRAGDHPGGPFICCPNCYRTGFQSTEQLDAHCIVCHTTLCLKEGCHNYGREAPFANPCRHSKKPSQRSIWRMWYRRARGLGPDAQIPETGGGTPPGTPLSRNRSQQSHADMPIPLLRTPSNHNRVPVQPTRSAPPAPRYVQSPMPTSVQMTLQESTNDLLQDLTPPALTSLTYLVESLETIARALLICINSSQPQLSRINDGWSAAALSGPPPQAIGTADYNVVYRVQMLRTLISEYRSLATNQSFRTQTAWAELRPMTLDLLRVQLPEQPPTGWLAEHPATVDVTHLYAGAAASTDQAAAATSHDLHDRVPTSTQAGPSAAYLPQPAQYAQVPSVPLDWGDELQSISTMVDGNRPPSYTQTQAYYGQGLDPINLQSQPFITVPAEARSARSRPSFSGYYSDSGSFDSGEGANKEQDAGNP